MKCKHGKFGGKRALRRVRSWFGLLAGASVVLAAGHLKAADIEASLFPGQSANATMSVTMPSLPPAADVLFSFDLTGSFGGVINTAKSNATTLMATLSASGISFRFGVSSFMDYPNTYSSCGYSGTYGGTGDYPYKLGQAMTASTNAVSTALKALVMGGGADGPESYTRVMYESYADTNVLWRTGAKHILVLFGDDMPHACNLNLGIPGKGSAVYSTGIDPGRDGRSGTVDDLVLQDVVGGMASNNVVMLAARFSGYYEPIYWSNWCARTGGKAIESTSISFITDLMYEITNALAISCVSNLHVVVDPPEYSSWVTIDPTNYDQMCSGETGGFNLVIKAPVGTPGDYSFTLRMRDSTDTEYVSKSVLVHVYEPVPLPVALNNTNLPWSTTPEGYWFGQNNISHDGAAAAQSDQPSQLNTTVTGPGTLTFWWRISTITNADTLTFSANGVAQAAISGVTGWLHPSIYISPGSQALAWVFDAPAGATSSDHVWVDQVSYVFGGTAPYITQQPTDLASVAGAPVTFSVTASGTPPLSYQWLKYGTNIPGATTSILAFSSPQNKDNGLYSVRISNVVTNIVSVNAALGVVPLFVVGDNSLSQLAVTGAATNLIAVAAGGWHSLGLRLDGSVIAWGANTHGECAVPADLADVVALAAGTYHSLALKANGQVVAWGDSTYGQATPPAGLSNVIAVAAGTWHSLALKSDGTVVGWGDDGWGQMDVPAGLANVIAIAAGGNHCLALRADGTVVGWGDNTDAYGTYVGEADVPVDLNNVVAIAAGEYHSLAVKADGSVRLWGDDSLGQIDVPTSLTNALALAGGGTHSVALKTDTHALGWGDNFNGQATFPSNLSNVVAVATGKDHTVVLLGVPPARPEPYRPQWNGAQFSLLLQTYSGESYALEYKDSLTASTWTALSTNRGNGAIQFLVDPDATAGHRYYRVRKW
jgi:hypothetical protein